MVTDHDEFFWCPVRTAWKPEQSNRAGRYALLDLLYARWLWQSLPTVECMVPESALKESVEVRHHLGCGKVMAI